MVKYIKDGPSLDIPLNICCRYEPKVMIEIDSIFLARIYKLLDKSFIEKAKEDGFNIDDKGRLQPLEKYKPRS